MVVLVLKIYIGAIIAVVNNSGQLEAQMTKSRDYANYYNHKNGVGLIYL